MTLSETAATYTEKASTRFLEVLEGMLKDEDILRQKVATKRDKYLSEGVAPDQVAKRLTKSYVEGAVLRSTTSGVASSLPVTLPLVGAIPTFAVVVSANTLYTFKNELELCYLVAYSNNTELEGEALQHRAFWLVGLSNLEDIKKQAKSLGVKITLKKLVEKLAVSSVSRGLAHFLHCGIGVSLGMGGGSFGFFVGAPISGLYGYRSTRGVAQRAVEFFAR